MELMELFKSKAKEHKKRIILPEGTEERTVEAAGLVAQEGIATPILVGNIEEINAIATKVNADLTGVEIIDVAQVADIEKYATALYELRKHKGMTMEKATELAKNPLYFGSLMLVLDEADGMVAGAENTTGDVLRAALQVVKTKPGIKTVSGAFVVVVPNCEYGDNGVFIFGDCAVNPNPTAEQLAEIACSCAETAKSLTGMEPKVGMLSFSTKGSAKHENVDKVVEATALAKEKNPELQIDGELQLDAAIVPNVAMKKAPGSDVAGQANVLVFPDLQAGNIGYKLVQRLAKATAVGPVLQGMAKPVNDLSRGCLVSDIVDMVAITALQCK